MVWYIAWLVGLWLIWQLTNAAGLTYDTSDAALMIKLLLAAAWTAGLYTASNHLEKSKGE